MIDTRNLVVLCLGASLGACIHPEQGIDRTVITGAVTIPPTQAKDPGDKQAPRDDLASAETLDLGWRWTELSGSIRNFQPTGGVDPVDPDQDWFVFATAAEGTFTAELSFETAPSSGTDTGASYADATVLDFEIYDLSNTDADGNPTAIAGGSTDGSGGQVTIQAEVAAGGSYALLVGALHAEGDADGLEYTAWLSGDSPSESGIKVGAYLPWDDVHDHGDPLGGGQVTDWSLDDATHTWSGSYRMLFLRQVSTAEDTATGEVSVDLTEGADTVQLLGSDMATLNQGLPAGTLYNGQDVIVTPGGLGDRTLQAPDMALDTLAPKVIGWVQEEVEPNDIPGDASTGMIDETQLDQAQQLPVASGLGYVDEITGAIEITDGAAQDWSTNDIDVFAFTVPEPLDLLASMGWSDSATDLDFVLYGTYGGEFVVFDWGASTANPEGFSLESDTGVFLEPDQTYYLAVFGYEGTEGSIPYTIDLEWGQP